jgi:c-di-AMP phosphodiesterase-like protein
MCFRILLLQACEFSTLPIVFGRMTAALRVILALSTTSLASATTSVLSDDGRRYLRSLASRFRKHTGTALAEITSVAGCQMSKEIKLKNRFFSTTFSHEKTVKKRKKRWKKVRNKKVRKGEENSVFSSFGERGTCVGASKDTGYMLGLTNVRHCTVLYVGLLQQGQLE